VQGEVAKPGAIQVDGHKTLIEVLSMVGGPSPNAGSRIKITRQAESGPIPLATAKTENGVSVAEVNLRLIEDRPADNIQIVPNDIISVPKADTVFVIGQVNKQGEFSLNDKRNISVVEALARAEYTSQTASRKNAKILREPPGQDLVTIPVNLDDVLNNKTAMVMMQPGDVLYVPDSFAKGETRKTLENVIQLATGLAIFH
jgi:polysaccharide export outer membrane protein